VSQNLGTRDGIATVIGTFYNHDDPLVYIMNQRDQITGIPLFPMRKKPATDDGTINGKAVFLPEATLARRRATNLYIFNCQQLLNPTSIGTEKLNYNHIIMVRRDELPENLYKFMLIDPAGDKASKSANTRNEDAWAIGVIGVEPQRHRDTGASKIYILDLVIQPMDLVLAQEIAVDMYCRAGRIIKLGIEKTGVSTAEIHIANALKTKNKYVSLANKNLEILRPAGRNKQFRIESALSLPLKNGEIHMLDTVPVPYQERLRMEMDKFPRWHDDGIDMLSYIYDVIKGYSFGIYKEETPEDVFQRAERKRHTWEKMDGWISV